MTQKRSIGRVLPSPPLESGRLLPLPCYHEAVGVSCPLFPSLHLWSRARELRDNQMGQVCSPVSLGRCLQSQWECSYPAARRQRVSSPCLPGRCPRGSVGSWTHNPVSPHPMSSQRDCLLKKENRTQSRVSQRNTLNTQERIENHSLSRSRKITTWVQKDKQQSPKLRWIRDWNYQGFKSSHHKKASKKQLRILLKQMKNRNS